MNLTCFGYYFTVTTEEEIDEFGTLVWLEADYLADADHTITSQKAAKASISMSGATYVAETAGVYAQDLGDVYCAVPYVRLANGEYVYGAMDDFSVLEYAQWAYTDADENTKSIVIDLLNYATAAKAFFCVEKGLEAPAVPYNSIIAESDRNVDAKWNDSLKRDDPEANEEGVFVDGYLGENINLLADIQIGRYYGTNVAGAYYWTEEAYNATDVHDATTKSGEAVMTLAGEAYEKWSMTELYAYNIYDVYYMRAYNEAGELGQTRGVSIASYLTWLVDTYENVDTEAGRATYALAKAMLVYGNNAETNPEVNKK